MTDDELPDDVQQYAENFARRSIGNSIVFFGHWNKLLQRDVDRATKIMIERQDQVHAKQIEWEEFAFHVRHLVHAAFAQVEGLSYVLRQIALWARDRGEIVLTDDEAAELKEVDRRNDAIVRRNSIVRNLELGYSMFSRALGLDPPLRIDKGGVGWRNFSAALEIRNDITHPKNLYSFSLLESLEKLDQFDKAKVWFWGEMTRLWKAAIEARGGTVPG